MVLGVAAVVVALTVDRSDQVAFNAALAGGGMLIGILFGLFWPGPAASKAHNAVVAVGAVGALALLAVGIEGPDGLALSRPTALIAMGGAVLSAIGGAAASNIP